MKLELGSGQRPTPGYVHNDINAFPGIDIVGNPWELDYADCTEVLALGVVEHLTFQQARDTFARIGCEFWFDVPDLAVWCRYLAYPETSPFPPEHVLATLYGWQRWPGDEHKSGWSRESLADALYEAGFTQITYGVDQFLDRGLRRRRMHRPSDAHIYVVAR